MIALIFDTETTGLIPKKAFKHNSSDDEIKKILPYIVQLSYILYDLETMTLLEEYDTIVKIDDDVEISPGALKTHGITKQMTSEKGVPVKVALDKIIDAYNRSDVVVAHNIEYDETLVQVELLRRGVKRDELKDTFSHLSKEFYCTMKNGKALCNIQVITQVGKVINKYVKYPTLCELHCKMFGVEPMNLHNSYFDILVCLRCYLQMTKKVDLCHQNEYVNEIFKSKLIPV